MSVSVGISKVLWYFLCGSSLLTSTVLSYAFILILSLLIPGISTTALTSLSVEVTSTNGSVSPLISGLPNPPNLCDGFTLPNSLTLGLPSGPTVIEYPYTIGPISLTFPPSWVVYSLTKSFGILFSTSSNSLSISRLISSNPLNISSKNPLLPPKNRLDQSNGSISSELKSIYLPIQYKPKIILKIF